MKNIQDLRLARDFKYTALYTSLRFYEKEPGVYVKNYDNSTIRIDYEKQIAVMPGITVLEDKLNGTTYLLTSHKSFVILECVDKLLSMGYKPQEIIIDSDNEYDIYCKNLYIKCYEWGHMDLNDNNKPKSNTFYSIRYESRLISGVIERNTKIVDYTGYVYDYGIFDENLRRDDYVLYVKNNIVASSCFVIKGDKLLSYKGNSKKVVVPNGIKELGSAAFWDNQYIEEVILPESLINLGGDTFYNCKKLTNITIPKNVKYMGNNPFAGCPNLNLVNKSANFVFKDNALFTADMEQLIYYSISSQNNRFVIPNGVKIICKHTFFLCDNLVEVTLPESLMKMENNPFSGCTKINVISNSKCYHIVDKVIYDEFYTSVCGCLASIDTSYLELLPVKRINRNSFWNCKGIRKIVLPATLEAIGYNPFVGCSDIHFKSNTDEFKVVDDVLYSKDMKTIICYPAWKSVGEVHIPDSVIKLERGAFSGSSKMTKINLHNVNTISKTCFTNCDSLREVYCSDLVTYIGEWAFAHCKNLKNVSVYNDTFIDKNAFLNSNVIVTKRNELSSLLIESDNQYSLESMCSRYKGKIDSILIDPPYNSHVDYIGYKDGDYDEGYLNFMKKRLDFSYKLLSSNGFLFINIDEGEYKLLAKLAKDIFGKENVSINKWEKLHPYFDINKEEKPGKKKVLYEYIIVCKKNKNSRLGKVKQPYFDGVDLKELLTKAPKIWRLFGTTSSAKDELATIFGRRDYFSTPKPVKLIKEFVRCTTSKDSLVVDFFAGSGTLGVAVDELNKEDNGNRKYIMICNNESNICKNVTKKRMDILNSIYQFLE